MKRHTFKLIKFDIDTLGAPTFMKSSKSVEIYS